MAAVPSDNLDSNAFLGAIPQAVRQAVFSELGLKDRYGTKLTHGLLVDLLLVMAFRPILGGLSALEEVISVRGAPRNWAKGYFPRSSQITEAKDRLGFEAMRAIFRAHVGWVNQEAPTPRWRGFRVGAIDGTTLRTEDTPGNSAAFGRPTGRGPAGFPQLRLLALVDVATHYVQAATYGPYSGKGSGEPSLLRDSLLQQVPADMLVLMDRGFSSYVTMREVMRADRSFLARMKHGGTWISPKKTETLLGGHDWLVEFPVPESLRPRKGAEPLKLRMLKLIVPKSRSKRSKARGARRAKAHRAKRKNAKRKATERKPVSRRTKPPRVIWLLTNLTDPAKYPYEELAPQYLRRWEVEFAFREIKSTMTKRKVEFRSKKPERVLQEAYAQLVAYNAVRLRMAQTAKAKRVKPHRLSFKRSLEAIRHAFLVQQPLRLLLPRIARYRLEEREPRSYPREVKARATRFPTKLSSNAA